MGVDEAQFEVKADSDASKAPDKAAAQKGGGKGPGKGGGKGAKGGPPKSKVQSQKDKLLSWSGFDDTYKASEVLRHPLHD